MGLGVVAMIAAPLFDLAMGVPRRRAFWAWGDMDVP